MPLSEAPARIARLASPVFGRARAGFLTEAGEGLGALGRSCPASFPSPGFGAPASPEPVAPGSGLGSGFSGALTVTLTAPPALSPFSAKPTE